MGDRRARQAVVVVHGIGEQRPMATVSQYVSATTAPDDLVYGAPDTMSGYSDLRRTKITWQPSFEAVDPSLGVPPHQTDFYELYWAHLIEGTQVRHVTGWLWAMIPRWRAIGSRFWRFLRYHLAIAIVAIAVAVGAIAASYHVDRPAWLDGPVNVLRVLVSAAAVAWIVKHLGDVPRYLNNVADNVQVQRTVRREGVDLLRRLHEARYRGSKRPKYDRIVVIGHSLGSVIAYDVVRAYWTEVNAFYATDPADRSSAANNASEAVEAAGEELWRHGGTGSTRGDEGFSAFQRRQRTLAAELPNAASRPPGVPETRRWAVTDLLTLACPLTHADILLAPDVDALAEAQRQRSLSSCPPRRQTASARYRFRYVRGPRTGLESFHQAACFAPTRWTNVYFSADVVGGPLQKLFGPGVVDIELANPAGIKGRMPKVHSQYARDAASTSVIRRVVFDGGQRSGAHTLEPARRRALTAAVAELVDVETGALGRVIAGIPSLIPLSPAHRDALADIVAHERGTDLDAMVAVILARLPDVLTHIPALDPALDPGGEENEEDDEDDEDAADGSDGRSPHPGGTDEHREEEEEEEELEEEEEE